MNQTTLTAEQFEELAAEITGQFDTAAAALEANGIPAFDNQEMLQKIHARYDSLAERLFRHNCGEPWAARENCLWVKIREVLRTSQQPLRVSISGEGPDEAIYLIDHHGNQVLAQRAIDERLAQENWLKSHMLDMTKQITGEVDQSLPVHRILVDEAPVLIGGAAQALLSTYVGLLSGIRHIEGEGTDPAWLARSLRLQSMDEARERIVEMAQAGAESQGQIYQELAEKAYADLFSGEQGSMFTEEQRAELIRRMGVACAKPAMVVVKLGMKVMQNWLEMRKNGQN